MYPCPSAPTRRHAPCPPPPPPPPPSDTDLLVHIAHLADALPADDGLGTGLHPDTTGADPTASAVVFGFTVDDDAVDLHATTIDGHPADALRGLVAPVDWHGLGVVAHGWAGTYAGDHPSRGSLRDRRRVRIVHLVARSHASVQLITAGADEPPLLSVHATTPTDDVGQIDDHLRRALGLPTAPAPASSLELFAQIWLDLVFAEATAGRLRGASWADVAAHHTVFEVIRDRVGGAERDAMVAWAAEHLETAGRLEAEAHPWPAIHAAAGLGRGPVVVDADFAAWMDLGMFARTVLGTFAPLPALVDDLRHLLDAEPYDRLVRTVTAWGLTAPADGDRMR